MKFADIVVIVLSIINIVISLVQYKKHSLQERYFDNFIIGISIIILIILILL